MKVKLGQLGHQENSPIALRRLLLLLLLLRHRVSRIARTIMAWGGEGREASVVGLPQISLTNARTDRQGVCLSVRLLYESEEGNGNDNLN